MRAEFGIHTTTARGGDALATAQLLSHYLKVASYAPPWTDALAASRQYPWPQFHGVAPELTMRHRNETALRHGAWLDRIVARMPRARSPVVDEYLALLEPVSYTHLDVYKRQAMTHTKPSVMFVCVHNAGRSQICLLYTSRCV